ncbi:hypothetical protein HQ39_00650 [Porphyromonas sp. COT-108 OH2963]|nr:hypothetical protein HQ39_00650 [Porphyromonas sp. COT-108 OH2963]
MILAIASIAFVWIDRCIKLKIRKEELEHERKIDKFRQDAILNNHADWQRVIQSVLKSNEEIIKSCRDKH